MVVQYGQRLQTMLSAEKDLEQQMKANLRTLLQDACHSIENNFQREEQ